MKLIYLTAAILTLASHNGSVKAGMEKVIVSCPDPKSVSEHCHSTSDKGFSPWDCSYIDNNNYIWKEIGKYNHYGKTGPNFDSVVVSKDGLGCLYTESGEREGVELGVPAPFKNCKERSKTELECEKKQTVAQITCYSNENGGTIQIACSGKGGAVYNFPCNEAPQFLRKSTQPLYLNACKITAMLAGCPRKGFAVEAGVHSLEPGQKYRVDLHTKTDETPCHGTITK